MRLITYQSETGPRVAGLREGRWIDLNANDPGLPSDLCALLAMGPDGLKRAEEAIASGKPIENDNPPRLAPVLLPEKIICVGLNYADHARESGAQPPPVPVIFNKFPSALIGPEQPILVPPVSEEVDFEAELVLVIGRQGRNITQDDALDYVAGYTCGNDVSARDWQLRKPGGQWLLGKTFDTFAPTGPEFVTADELPDPNRLRICSRLNGEVMQDSSTAQFIFSVQYLVSYISQVCTLKPGDLIFTGTPPGVGFSRQPPVFLKPGDVIEIEVEGIGILRNPVAS